MWTLIKPVRLHYGSIVLCELNVIKVKCESSLQRKLDSSMIAELLHHLTAQQNEFIFLCLLDFCWLLNSESNVHTSSCTIYPDSKNIRNTFCNNNINTYKDSLLQRLDLISAFERDYSLMTAVWMCH